MTSNEADYLAHAKDMQRKGFAGVFSGRLFRKYMFERLKSRGFFREQWLYVSDGDGFALEPERKRLGYTLTTGGEQALTAYEVANPARA